LKLIELKIHKVLKINHYLFLFAITFICCAPLRAASTLAGTVISNQAQLSYSINSIAQTPVPSNIASFTVLEIVNLNLVWQDAGQVRVNTPQLNAPLAFTLSNTGNGPQTYNLTRANTITGDQFDPINPATGAMVCLRAFKQMALMQTQSTYPVAIAWPWRPVHHESFMS
jgi:hypothetical protein